MTVTIDQFVGLATARHCTRAFAGGPVPREILDRVLAAAAHAPSTRNGQPWRVEVVTGAALDGLVTRLCGEFDRGTPPRLEYRNRPPRPDPVAEQRARAAGAGVLAAFGIARDDEPARRAHLRRNLRFYGAPVALVCHLPAGCGAGTFLELGFFLQNVMLGLVAAGLGSCPQASVASYPDVLRERLGLGPDRLIVCTLAVGYPDPEAPVNAFVPARAAVAEYVRWHRQPLPVPWAMAIRGDAAEPAAVRAPAVGTAGESTTCSHSRERTS